MDGYPCLTCIAPFYQRLSLVCAAACICHGTHCRAAAPCLAPLCPSSHQATCLQTMYDYLIKASGYVEEMKVAFKGVRDEHE